MPEQPNKPKYGVEELFLFPIMTAQQVPGFKLNPSAPYQAWRDTNVSPTSWAITTYAAMWDPNTKTILVNQQWPDWFSANYNFSREFQNGKQAPIPMRPLLPNEKLVHKSSPFDNGPDAWIERTDLFGAVQVLTVDQKLDKLLAHFGIQ